MTTPHTSQVLLERLTAGSKPGARDDPHRVALAVEGGGMRSVVSGGMLLAIEQLGLRDCFDLVVGTSAGAISAALFVSSLTTEGSVLYYDELNQAPFLDKRRLLRLGAALDLDHLVDHALPRRGLNLGEVGRQPIATFATVTPVVQDNPTRVLRLAGDARRVGAILKATASLPVLAGPSKEVDGELYVDGGLHEQVPWRSAASLGATHILVLPSRPVLAEEIRSPMSFVERFTVLPVVRSLHGDHVADLTETLPGRASRDATVLRSVHGETSHALTHDMQPWSGDVAIVELGADVHLPDRLETERAKLVDGLVAGAQAVLQQFGLAGMSVEQRVVINHPVARVTNYRSQALADIVAVQDDLDPTPTEVPTD